jgi:acetolactate synthase I/II/III large subunit
MTASSMRFVDWLAADLAKRGTRFAFGVPGGGISLDLLEASQSAGMQTVITAREDAAAMMAGVAGRLANAPGLAFSTKGPGLASATNGLASALLDRLPTLMVAEHFDPEELVFLSHQVFDQAALANGLFGDIAGGKSRAIAPDPIAVTSALQGMMQAPMGPSVLLADPHMMTAQIDISAIEPSDTLADEAPSSAIDQAIQAIKKAKRPVIVAGLEATTPGVAAGVHALSSALGAPVLVTYMAKGVVPDSHPNFAGIFTGGAIEQACVNAADMIILVGVDPVELIRKPWPYSMPVVDLCAYAHSPHYLVPTARAEGDLASTVAAVAGGVHAGNWTSAEAAQHRDAISAGMSMTSDSGLSPVQVVEGVFAAFGSTPRLTVDAGAHMFSACAFWQAEQPLDVLISNGLASMGFALPAAIAAALHEPERGAVAMTGDGGFLMCLGELKTAAAMNANLTVVVFNDACLSLIDIKREQRQMQDLGLSWEAPDFTKVAAGFGFSTWLASNPAELRSAADAAAATSGPCLIDARIDASGYLGQLRALRG